MRKLHWITLAVTTAVLVAGSSVGMRAEAAKCVRAGGQATMITEDLAKFMANAALKNSISGMNAKAVGPVAMKCDTGSGLPTCTARQKACK